jgi:hypothetical protein
MRVAVDGGEEEFLTPQPGCLPYSQALKVTHEETRLNTLRRIMTMSKLPPVLYAFSDDGKFQASKSWVML